MSDKICAVGQYCQSSTMSCQREKGLNQICDDFYSCGFGRGCFPDSETLTKRCIDYFSLEDGAETYGDAHQEFCLSGHHIKVGNKFYCMRAPQSVTPTDQPQDGEQECKFKVFKDINKPDWYEYETEISRCGMNTDAATYCDVQK